MTNGRKAFLQTLTELATHDPKIILIVGDVGFSFIEDFKAKFPNQYLNAGVLEQSMMGIACGLARAGWKPYVYTMINFIVFRPFEQVRNDICYSNANVKLFGVEGSAAYKFLGYSHNIAPGEDIKMLDGLPNLSMYVPKTEEFIVEKMKLEYQRKGPAYFRI
jgi:transketolase